MLLETRDAPPFYKNGYVLACEQTREGVIIDPGDEVDQLLNVVAEQKLQVRMILLTHAHADHAGACRAWRDRLGVDVAASEEAGRYLRDGDEEKVSLAIARQGGFYPADYVYHACPVAHTLREGDVFQVGNLAVRAIETPGHCSGMLSYLLDDAGRQVLFTGDTVFHDGKVLISNLWDCDLRQYVKSIDKLAEVPADVMLPGHLAISLSDGGRHIRKAFSIMQNLSFPASII